MEAPLMCCFISFQANTPDPCRDGECGEFELRDLIYGVRIVLNGSASWKLPL